jgi:hypothetical protein
MADAEAKAAAAGIALKDAKAELADLKADRKHEDDLQAERRAQERLESIKLLMRGLEFRDPIYAPTLASIVFVLVAALCYWLAGKPPIVEDEYQWQVLVQLGLVGLMAFAIFRTTALYSYHAKVVSLVNADEEDLRPDANALQDLVHDESLYARVHFSWKIFEIVTVPRIFQRAHNGLCSVELFTQLRVPAIVDYDADDSTVWTRIKQGGRTSHKTNITRYAALRKDDIYFDTQMLTYVAYRDGKDARSMHPFPHSQL